MAQPGARAGGPPPLPPTGGLTAPPLPAAVLDACGRQAPRAHIVWLLTQADRWSDAIQVAQHGVASWNGGGPPHPSPFRSPLPPLTLPVSAPGGSVVLDAEAVATAFDRQVYTAVPHTVFVDAFGAVSRLAPTKPHGGELEALWLACLLSGGVEWRRPATHTSVLAALTHPDAHHLAPSPSTAMVDPSRRDPYGDLQRAAGVIALWVQRASGALLTPHPEWPDASPLLPSIIVAHRAQSALCGWAHAGYVDAMGGEECDDGEEEWGEVSIAWPHTGVMVEEGEGVYEGPEDEEEGGGGGPHVTRPSVVGHPAPLSSPTPMSTFAAPVRGVRGGRMASTESMPPGWPGGTSGGAVIPHPTATTAAAAAMVDMLPLPMPPAPQATPHRPYPAQLVGREVHAVDDAGVDDVGDSGYRGVMRGLTVAFPATAYPRTGVASALPTDLDSGLTSTSAAASVTASLATRNDVASVGGGGTGSGGPGKGIVTRIRSLPALAGGGRGRGRPSWKDRTGSVGTDGPPMALSARSSITHRHGSFSRRTISFGDGGGGITGGASHAGGVGGGVAWVAEAASAARGTGNDLPAFPTPIAVGGASGWAMGDSAAVASYPLSPWTPPHHHYPTQRVLTQAHDPKDGAMFGYEDTPHLFGIRKPHGVPGCAVLASLPSPPAFTLAPTSTSGAAPPSTSIGGMVAVMGGRVRASAGPAGGHSAPPPPPPPPPPPAPAPAAATSGRSLFDSLLRMRGRATTEPALPVVGSGGTASAALPAPPAPAGPPPALTSSGGSVASTGSRRSVPAPPPIPPPPSTAPPLRHSISSGGTTAAAGVAPIGGIGGAGAAPSAPHQPANTKPAPAIPLAGNGSTTSSSEEDGGPPASQAGGTTAGARLPCTADRLAPFHAHRASREDGEAGMAAGAQLGPGDTRRSSRTSMSHLLAPTFPQARSTDAHAPGGAMVDGSVGVGGRDGADGAGEAMPTTTNTHDDDDEGELRLDGVLYRHHVGAGTGVALGNGSGSGRMPGWLSHLSRMVRDSLFSATGSGGAGVPTSDASHAASQSPLPPTEVAFTSHPPGPRSARPPPPRGASRTMQPSASSEVAPGAQPTAVQPASSARTSGSSTGGSPHKLQRMQTEHDEKSIVRPATRTSSPATTFAALPMLPAATGAAEHAGGEVGPGMLPPPSGDAAQARAFSSDQPSSIAALFYNAPREATWSTSSDDGTASRKGSGRDTPVPPTMGNGDAGTSPHVTALVNPGDSASDTDDDGVGSPGMGVPQLPPADASGVQGWGRDTTWDRHDLLLVPSTLDGGVDEDRLTPRQRSALQRLCDASATVLPTSSPLSPQCGNGRLMLPPWLREVLAAGNTFNAYMATFPTALLAATLVQQTALPPQEHVPHGLGSVGMVGGHAPICSADTPGGADGGAKVPTPTFPHPTRLVLMHMQGGGGGPMEVSHEGDGNPVVSVTVSGGAYQHAGMDFVSPLMMLCVLAGCAGWGVFPHPCSASPTPPVATLFDTITLNLAYAKCAEAMHDPVTRMGLVVAAGNVVTNACGHGVGWLPRCGGGMWEGSTASQGNTRDGVWYRMQRSVSRDSRHGFRHNRSGSGGRVLRHAISGGSEGSMAPTPTTSRSVSTDTVTLVPLLPSSMGRTPSSNSGTVSGLAIHAYATPPTMHLNSPTFPSATCTKRGSLVSHLPDIEPPPAAASTRGATSEGGRSISTGSGGMAVSLVPWRGGGGQPQPGPTAATSHLTHRTPVHGLTTPSAGGVAGSGSASPSANSAHPHHQDATTPLTSRTSHSSGEADTPASPTAGPTTLTRTHLPSPPTQWSSIILPPITLALTVDLTPEACARDAYGRTMLHLVAEWPHQRWSDAPAIIARLIAVGCPVDTLDNFGRTALTVATVRSNAVAMRALLAAGAHPHGVAGVVHRVHRSMKALHKARTTSPAWTVDDACFAACCAVCPVPLSGRLALAVAPTPAPGTTSCTPPSPPPAAWLGLAAPSTDAASDATPSTIDWRDELAATTTTTAAARVVSGDGTGAYAVSGGAAMAAGVSVIHPSGMGTGMGSTVVYPLDTWQPDTLLTLQDGVRIIEWLRCLPLLAAAVPGGSYHHQPHAPAPPGAEVSAPASPSVGGTAWSGGQGLGITPPYGTASSSGGPSLPPPSSASGAAGTNPVTSTPPSPLPRSPFASSPSVHRASTPSHCVDTPVQPQPPPPTHAVTALRTLVTTTALPKPSLRTPLSMALDACDAAAVAALAGSDRCYMNDRDPQTGRTPLRHYLEHLLPSVTADTLAPSKEVLLSLLTGGADVNRQHWVHDRGYRTPLQICMSYARHSASEHARVATLETIKQLCRVGADTGVVHAFDGKTPLHEACCTRDAEVACLLLSFGGVNLLRARDMKGRSPGQLIPPMGVDLSGYSHVASVTRFGQFVRVGVADGGWYRRRAAVIIAALQSVPSPAAAGQPAPSRHTSTSA